MIARLENIITIMKSVDGTISSPLREKLAALEPLYSLYNVRTLCEALEQTKKKDAALESTKVSKRSAIIMAVLLAVFALTTAGLFVSFNSRLDRQLEQQNKLQRIIDEQYVSIQELQDTLTQDTQGSDSAI